MNKGRNIIIAALLIAIAGLAAAYASFATQLQITNSKATIAGNWNVEITNIEATSVTGTATSKEGTPTFTSTTASFDANLVAPGDSITYTVTIQNKGTIPAKLNAGSPVFTEQPDGSPAIVYTTTNPGATLAAGETTTFTVTATYDANTTVVPEVKTKSFTATIDYVQSTNQS